MRSEPPLLAPVFRSEGQARILAALLISDDELSLTELAGRAAVPYPSAHREVARLRDAGILRERRVGRTRLVSGNPDSALVGPLRAILLIAAGPVPLLSEELGRIDGVQHAFVFGSFAARARGIPGEPPRDIDLMVIGTPDATSVYDACARLEPSVGRPINATILSPSEWREHSAFLDDVRANPMLPIIGESV
jgi:DNA-binding transcriptional ArsR family regulator